MPNLLQKNRTPYGLRYLVTITAADEAQLVGAQAPQDGLVEGCRKEGVGNGKLDLEAGTLMTYSNWTNGETNDNNEDYAHITFELDEQVPGMTYRILRNLIQIVLITLKAILSSTAGCLEIQFYKFLSEYYNCNSKNREYFQVPFVDSGCFTSYRLKWQCVLVHYSNWRFSYRYRKFIHYTLSTTTSYYVDGTNGNCQDIPRTERLPP
jgi:hypothetical protein